MAQRMLECKTVAIPLETIMRSKQSGFTLVEIAIVLVIIGLLLGGVLKGQELINSAKVKNMINDFRTVSTFVYAYQDRFKALPGDDSGVVNHVNGTLATTPGVVGDGRIQGNWNSLTPTDESYLFWQHVRLAGLASGPTTVPAAPAAGDDYNARNADGGRLGITSVTPIANWAGTFFVCSANINGRLARQIDSTLDDGNTSTGTVRIVNANGGGGGEQANGVAYQAQPTAADDATLFTVCVAY